MENQKDEVNAIASRRLHNSQQPVSNLPSELLSECFSLAMHKSWDGLYTLEPPICGTMRSRLGLVCSHWYAVLLNNPLFWTHISCIHPDWANIMLQRRAGVSFSLYFSGSGHGDRLAAFRLALNHRNALRAVYLTGFTHTLHDRLMDLFHEATAPTEVLHVAYLGGPEHSYQRLIVDAKAIPYLRSLCLTGCYPSPKLVSASLTRLSIEFDDQALATFVLSTAAVLDILERTPNLEYLRLVNFLPDVFDVVEDERVIDWKVPLKELELRGAACDIASLLGGHVLASASATILRLDGEIYGPNQAIPIRNEYLCRTRDLLSDITDPVFHIAVERLDIQISTMNTERIRLQAWDMTERAPGSLDLTLRIPGMRGADLKTVFDGLETPYLIEITLNSTRAGLMDDSAWSALLTRSPYLDRILVDAVPTALFDLLLSGDLQMVPLLRTLAIEDASVEEVIPGWQAVRNAHPGVFRNLHLHGALLPGCDGEVCVACDLGRFWADCDLENIWENM